MCKAHCSSLHSLIALEWAAGTILMRSGRMEAHIWCENQVDKQGLLASLHWGR